MKDRMIELLLKCDKENDVLSCYNERPKIIQAAEIIADHLLANGVIVPPCKVGDKVYSCIGREYYVRRIIIKDGMPTTFLLESGLYGQLCVTESDFGSLAFLAKEEAEKALAGRSKE